MKFTIGHLVELYQTVDIDTFCVGRIKYFDNDILVLECFNSCGGYDGYFVTKISKIAKVSFNTKYLHKMSLLIEKCKDINIKSIEDVINLAFNNNRVVAGLIKRHHYMYNFRFSDINDDLLTIEYIDNYGELYKKETINRNDIYNIEIDDRYLCSLEKLLSLKNK